MLLGTFYNDKRVTPLRTYREKKGEINMSTITLRDFNTPLSITDRASRQMNKETEDLHNTVYQRHNRHPSSTQQLQNTHSSQVYMKHSQG